MAHLKLNRFFPISNLKGPSKEPQHARKIDYEAIKRQNKLSGQSNFTGNWFEFKRMSTESFKNDGFLHPLYDSEQFVTPIIYCKTLENGQIDTEAKLCGAPEPPFQGDETSGVTNDNKNSKENQSQSNKLTLLRIIREEMCQSFEEIEPFYYYNTLADYLKKKQIEFISPISKEEQIHCKDEAHLNSDIKTHESCITCCKIIDNYFSRKYYTELNFEDELLLFIVNFEKCKLIYNIAQNENYFNLILGTFYTYLSLVVNIESEQYLNKAKAYLNKVNTNQINESLKQLKDTLDKINSKQGEFCLQNIEILACTNPNNLWDGLNFSNLVNGNIVQSNDIKVTYSNDKNIFKFLSNIKKNKIIFLLGHGDEKLGMVYYFNGQEDYIPSNIFNQNKPKMVGFFSCSAEIYEDLIDKIKYVILPVDSTSNFEHSEMFIKSFIGCYKRTKNYKFSLKIANYACEIFPYYKSIYNISGI